MIAVPNEGGSSVRFHKLRWQDFAAMIRTETMSVTNHRIQLSLVAVALVAVTFGVYQPVTHYDFVNFDDPVYVTENAIVQRGLNPAGIAWAFTNVEAEFWQPFVWLTHMMDCQFYGLRAGGHHMTSLVFQMVNTVLLFLVLTKMTGAIWRSGCVAALFSLHPLHVESVAWIASRKDVVSSFFGLLSVWAYVEFAQRLQGGKRKACIFYWLAILLFAASLMSKPIWVTLPVLLLLLDYWPLRRVEFRQTRPEFKMFHSLLREKIPFLTLSVAAGVATIWIQAGRHNVAGLEDYPLSLRLSNAVMSCFQYLRKVFWPSDLAAFYPYPDAWPIVKVAGAVIFLAAVSWLAFRLAKRQPVCVVGWLWYLVSLLPVAGLVQVSHHAMADRYTYVPLIGVFVMLVWGVAELLTGLRGGRMMLALAGTATVLVCAVGGRQQLTVWENSVALNQHALAVTKNNYIAHANLGAALADQKKFDEALDQFETAVAIQSALRFNPDLPSIRFALGTALALKGRLPEARGHFLRVLEVQPNVPRVHHNLASVLTLQGELSEAIAHYQAALQLNPDYHEARTNLAIVLAQSQRWEAASTHFVSGDSLLKQERYREAIDEFHQSLKLRPDWVEVMNNLAWLRATHSRAEVRDGAEAVALAKRACALTSRTNVWMLSTLAAAYAEAGDFSSAAKTQEEVCALAVTLTNGAATDSFRQRLELYRSGKPYRQP